MNFVYACSKESLDYLQERVNQLGESNCITVDAFCSAARANRTNVMEWLMSHKTFKSLNFSRFAETELKNIARTGAVDALDFIYHRKNFFGWNMVNVLLEASNGNHFSVLRWFEQLLMNREKVLEKMGVTCNIEVE